MGQCKPQNTQQNDGISKLHAPNVNVKPNSYIFMNEFTYWRASQNVPDRLIFDGNYVRPYNWGRLHVKR